MINARITFSNIQALDIPVQGVTSVREDSGRSSVAIDDAVFATPRSYEVLGGASENTMRLYGHNNEEEEIMLQYAIRQSLGETNGDQADQVDIWEALEGLPPGHSRVNFQGEDRLLQQAIEVNVYIFTITNIPNDREVTWSDIIMRLFKAIPMNKDKYNH